METVVEIFNHQNINIGRVKGSIYTTKVYKRGPRRFINSKGNGYTFSLKELERASEAGATVVHLVLPNKKVIEADMKECLDWRDLRNGSKGPFYVVYDEYFKEV